MWSDLAVAYAAAMSLVVTVLAGSAAVAGELNGFQVGYSAMLVSVSQTRSAEASMSICMCSGFHRPISPNAR